MHSAPKPIIIFVQFFHLHQEFNFRELEDKYIITSEEPCISKSVTRSLHELLTQIPALRAQWKCGCKCGRCFGTVYINGSNIVQVNYVFPTLVWCDLVRMMLVLLLAPC